MSQKEGKSAYNKDTCTPMLIEVQFTVAKLWNQPRCPLTDEWIKKMWHICKMEFSHIRRMKFHHLHKNGWNWKSFY
jgi:hypothetical protein